MKISISICCTVGSYQKICPIKVRSINWNKLDIHRYNSGPEGGDQQIGAMLAKGELDLIIFLRDPLTAQPHEPDVSALLRLCDVQKIPLATNASSAKIMLEALKNKMFFESLTEN